MKHIRLFIILYIFFLAASSVYANSRLDDLVNDVLNSRIDSIRKNAFYKLKRYPRRRILKNWLYILENTKSFIVKKDVIDFLSNINDRRIVIPIANQLKSPYFLVRKSAAKALRKCGDDRMYPIILKMSSSEDPIYKIYTVEAMFHLYDRRFFNIINKLLKDENKSVRIFVIKCIKENKLREIMHLLRWSAQNDRSYEVRISAIRAIGDFRDINALYVLFNALHDKEKKIRIASIESIYDIGSYRSVAPLSNRLIVEKDNDVKNMIINSIVKFKKVENMAGLKKIILHDRKSRLRIRSAFALGEIKDYRAAPILLEAINDSNYRVRGEICNSLANYKQKPVIKELLKVIENDSKIYVRSIALQSIKKIKNRTTLLPLFNLYTREKDPVFKEFLREVIDHFIKKFV